MLLRGKTAAAAAAFPTTGGAGCLCGYGQVVVIEDSVGIGLPHCVIQ